MSTEHTPPPNNGESGITRRRFVTGLGAGAAAAVAAGYGLSVWASGDSSPDEHRGQTPDSARARRARRPHARRRRARRRQRRSLHARADDRSRVSRFAADARGHERHRARRFRRAPPEPGQAGRPLPGGAGGRRRRRRVSRARSLALRVARNVVGGGAGGQRQRRMARPLPRRHRRLRGSARGAQHRPGAVAGTDRPPVVRDVDHRHHRAPAVGAGLGGVARRPHRAMVEVHARVS